jgi:cytochrome P450
VFAGTELDPAVSAKKRGKIVGRLEALVEELHGRKPATDAVDDLARRLKDALASNTIGGGRKREDAVDWRQASEEVFRLQANWAKIAPVPGDEGRTLSERFERAFKSFLERRPPERSRGPSRDRASVSRPQSRA